MKEIDWKIWEKLTFTGMYDLRLKLINEKLLSMKHVLPKDITIVDMNCGTGRLLKYLDWEGGVEYIGNDIMAKYLAEIAKYPKPRGHSYSAIQIEDKDLEKFLAAEGVDNIDVLMSLGHGAGEYTGGVESPTATKTFQSLVKKYTPELVVYENIEKYQRQYGMVTQMTDFLFLRGYKRGSEFRIDYSPESVSIGSKRMLVFFTISI